MIKSTVDAKVTPVSFHSNDARLDAGFQWAKEQALAYLRRGDPVGDWYEASLPGRDAFCMRDTAHQSTGASVLGLGLVTKNMLRKFAQSIAESRDFCCYWEIDRLDRPAPVDYASDEDFWYNLPANFDVLDACLRQYLWSGDEDYLWDQDFLRFYEITVNQYVQRWDVNGDGLLERARDGSRRGIASYDEVEYLWGAEVMSDLVAIQARGYDSYATFCLLRGFPELAREYSRKAAELRQIFADQWWDATLGRFYKARFPGGRMLHATGDLQPDPGASHLALYFGSVTDPRHLALELDAVASVTHINVEALTYFPGIFYRYKQTERAFDFLSRLIDPNLERRNYPEVSFCVIGDIVEGLMGVHPCASKTLAGLRSIETRPGLPAGLKRARIDSLPVFDAATEDASREDGTITVEHTGEGSILENHTSAAVVWIAFPAPGKQNETTSVTSIVATGEMVQVRFGSS